VSPPSFLPSLHVVPFAHALMGWFLQRL
jgi:hypothetical protein